MIVQCGGRKVVFELKVLEMFLAIVLIIQPVQNSSHINTKFDESLGLSYMIVQPLCPQDHRIFNPPSLDIYSDMHSPLIVDLIIFFTLFAYILFPCAM